MLALEARVVALETTTARRSEKSQRAESLARDMSESNLNFRLDLLALIEDHVELLKLVHNMVGPADRVKNKQVLTFIQRAESKLAQFQSQFAQLEARHNPSAPVVPPIPAPRANRSRALAYLNPLTLYRSLRPAAWWNL